METAKTIILVEDDLGCVQLTCRYLDRADIRNPVLHFSQGQDCLDFLLRHFAENPVSPEYIIILDLKLPDIAGIEVLRLIRGSGLTALRQLPVIIHTTSERIEDRRQCQELGVNAFCIKNFRESFELAAILENWLNCSGDFAGLSL